MSVTRIGEHEFLKSEATARSNQAGTPRLTIAQQAAKKMFTRNKEILPTYLQLGNNAVERGEQLYEYKRDRGIVGATGGKKTDIPIDSNIMSK